MSELSSNPTFRKKRKYLYYFWIYHKHPISCLFIYLFIFYEQKIGLGPYFMLLIPYFWECVMCHFNSIQFNIYILAALMSGLDSLFNLMLLVAQKKKKKKCNASYVVLL